MILIGHQLYTNLTFDLVTLKAAIGSIKSLLQLLLLKYEFLKHVLYFVESAAAFNEFKYFLPKSYL